MTAAPVHESANETWDAVVVGGGHNGLVAAAYLARAGLRVLVLERREIVGGACVTEEPFPGYRVSTAAYLCSLLQEKVVRDLELERFGYRVYAKDPAFFTPFRDGRHLTMWQDRRRTCAEIARFSPRDAERYPAYEDAIEDLARFAERMFLRTPPNVVRIRPWDLWEAARLAWDGATMREAERIGHVAVFTQSVADFLDRWFESDELKVTLATDGVIGTSGGPMSPGTAYVLLHHVMGKVDGHRGLWGFVRGGMGGVSEAIAASGRAAGAVVRTNADVARILVRGGRACGVALRSGEEIAAGAVLSNADPKVTFLDLLEPSALEPRFRDHVRALRMKGASMKINLALSGLPSFSAVPGSQLQPHHRSTIHLCESIDALERAWDDAKHGAPSREPLIEMTLPTTYDDSLAPAGRHVMGIFLQYAPYDLREGDWNGRREAYADHVVDTIEGYAPGFRDLVLHRQVLAPPDIERIYGMTGGNIFHGDMGADQLFSMRPVPGWARYRTPVRDLWLCGSGAHPGGGVTGAPGHNAAREFLRERRLRELPKRLRRLVPIG